MINSPSRYKSTGSPVRNLDEKYSTRPLETILEENTALRRSNSLIFQNQMLEKENQKLFYEFSKTKELENQQYQEKLQLKKEKELLQQNYRTLEARSQAQNEAKERQLEGQERDIRLLREEYGRDNLALKDQISSLINKIALLEANKLEDIENLKKKYISNTNEETSFLRKNMGEEIRHVLGELEITRQILGEKERELDHLIAVSHKNSAEYTANLENFITQNNILRNQLLALELEKNKEIQQAENKKELEKSRTIGILSYCKENNHFIDKELTRLAQQLLEKNISIESFTKELLKQRKHSDQNQRKFEETINRLKQQHEDTLKQTIRQHEKSQKNFKEDLAEIRKSHAQLQEQLDSKNHEIQTIQRELDYNKEQQSLKDREIQELKESISRMHEDHSKQLSKVMVDSRVKRRSGLNISSYSSSSLKDIEQAQGSSILKGGHLDRKSSFSNEGSGRLPTVKEELAVSRGNLDDDEQEDLEVKELILHYEQMILEQKKKMETEIEISNNRIDSLKRNLQQKQEELIEILTKFSPLLDFKMNKASIDEERKAKIEQSYKGDLSILSIYLDKYKIASLRPRQT